MRQARGALAAALFALLLSACAGQPAREPAPDPRIAWRLHSAGIAELSDWRVVGRIAVTTATDGGRAELDWRQSPESSEIRLVAPFGQGSVALSESRAGVILRRPDQRPIQGRDPEQVLAQAIGWRVPVARLRRWIVGLPDVDESYQLDSWGRLASVDYDGWQVRYLGYRRVAERELPERIELDKGEIKVRLAIEAWNAEVGRGQSQRIQIPGVPAQTL